MSTDAELQAAGIAVPKRTDLPWEFIEGEWNRHCSETDLSAGSIYSQTAGWYIATLEDTGDDDGGKAEQIANAQFIVTAVNAHDDLVAALKQLLPVAYACKHEDFGNVDGAEWTRTEAIERSVAALRKAGAL